MQKAIICDIDGTLAKMGDRGPFEWEKVGLDTINYPVQEILNRFNDIYSPYVVILMSGRDEVCRGETEMWLLQNKVKFQDLFMRPHKDNRKDSIVKLELYNTHIKDKYDVVFVLDDRNQVVEMWRKDLGLTCLQVDYGDF